uniref:Uncharacterized protein n=1 Tax=Steinernema glaseri TaxID=37863 RepID=A0A1I7Z0W7_9BILA
MQAVVHMFGQKPDKRHSIPDAYSTFTSPTAVVLRRPGTIVLRVAGTASFSRITALFIERAPDSRRRHRVRFRSPFPFPYAFFSTSRCQPSATCQALVNLRLQLLQRSASVQRGEPRFRNWSTRLFPT